MARSKQSSGKKGGPRKPVAAPQIIDKPGAPPQDAGRGRVSRRTLLIIAAVAAVIAVLGGSAFWFLTEGPRIALFGSAPTERAATFVGSDTCAGCHGAEAQLWRGSQHQLAMQHATEK